MNTRYRWLCASLVSVLLLPAALTAQEAAAPSAAAPTAPADPTALLKAIPADATAFVAVRNLRELDADLNAVVQQLGLPQGVLPNLGELVRQKLGITEGFDDNASLAIAVLNTGDVKTAEAIVEKVVVLIPATDPDKVLAGFGGQKEGDVAKITLMGEESVAATKGRFVVVAKSPAAVTAAIQAKGEGILSTMSPDRVKAFAGQDIFAWANPRGISKELLQELSDGIKKALASGPMGAAGAQPATGMEQLDKIITQAQEFALAASLDQKKGLIFSWYARMKEGTELARQMAAIKGTERSLLVGLPNESYILAMGAMSSTDPATQEQMRQGIDNMFSTITQLAGTSVDAAKLNALKDPLVNLFGNVERLSVGVSSLPAEGGEGLVGLQMSAQVKDAAAWRGEARKLFGQLKEIIADAAAKEGAAPEKVKAVSDAVQWKEDAEEVGGMKVDHFMVDLQKLPADEGQSNEQTIEEVKSVIGKEGILVRVAAIGNNQVAMTFGGGAKRFAAIAESVKKNEAPLAENQDIKKMVDRQPAGPRVAEAYLSVANLLALVSNIAMEVGQPLPIPALRENVPVVVTSVKMGDAAQYSEILIPMELVTSVKEAMAPLFMMMMGGGGAPMEEPPQQPAPGGELN